MKDILKKIHNYRWYLLWFAALFVLLSYLAINREHRGRFGDLFIDDTKYSAEIKAAAKKHGLPPELVRAVVRKESGFDHGAEGKAGEIGLMQILPDGAVADWARINNRPKPAELDLFDAELNLDIGCWYLGRALRKWQKYRHGTELALAEYNAGAKNSNRWKPDTFNGKVVERIDFPVTRNYVQVIMKNYRKYCAESKSLAR